MSRIVWGSLVTGFVAAAVFVGLLAQDNGILNTLLTVAFAGSVGILVSDYRKLEILILKQELKQYTRKPSKPRRSTYKGKFGDG